MKYLIKKIAILAVILVTASHYSCDFLDVNDYFEETLKYDSVFHNKRNIERYLWATAAYFPDEGNLNQSPGPFATDEAFSLVQDFNGTRYVLGEVSPTQGLGMQHWTTMYIVIRKANTIIARIDEATDMDTLDKREVLAYAYFMRAYAYYHLLIKYGPVVLLGDDILENNESPEYYDKARATYDESVEYICTEFERAAKDMPASVSLNNFGRPTSGAALGMAARLRLMAASPIFNGKQAAMLYFGTWKRSTDGVNYISQQHDEKKWAVAALAAKRIIDLGTYSLHIVPRIENYTHELPANVSSDNFPDGAGDVDPFHSYADMFNGEALALRNPEFLWARTSSSLTGWTRYSFPAYPMGGWNSMGVTQKVIDAYLMIDGNAITNSSQEYPYSMTGFLGGSGKNFSGYFLPSSVSNMYVNREMRFYASIGFSECFWPAYSTSDGSKKNQIVTYYKDGTAGKELTNESPDNYPITGYVLKKFIHPDDAWDGDNAKVIDKTYPIIRYAEILLSYVEAINNLTSSHTVTDEISGASHTFFRDENEIKKYFNMVRYRAGLPGLTREELSSPQKIQQLIERERMIEFLFEDRRYFDVRRWGIYEQTEREPIMGMDTNAKKSDYYNIVPVNHSKARQRVVDKKLVLFPILLDEVRKAPSLDQNPGWQD